MVGPTPNVRSIDPDRVAVFEVRPGLWNVRIPLVWPGISHVNAIVLAGAGGGVTLVDCGTAGDPTCWDALVTGLARTGNGIDNVTDLVVTHAHSDHFGLAARVVAESGCTMWMHPAHEAFTDGALEPARIYAARERRARAEGVPEDVLDQYADTGEETDFALVPLPPFRELRGGMQVPSAVGPWDVLETPGHSPSHLCLHQPQERLLILGDLVSRVFAPWYDYGYTADPVAELAASLDLVAGLDVELALPGHGRPIEDLAEVIEMHHEEIARRLELVEAEVARQPGPAYEIGLRAFGPSPSMMAEVGRLQEAMACLRHLRLQGRVLREELPSGVFRYSPAGGGLVEDGARVDAR
jgi:glyoxylase-like metal-dependent hydrolase (beta-lactamase superfamily II)